jgi:prephenate dehydratase
MSGGGVERVDPFGGPAEPVWTGAPLDDAARGATGWTGAEPVRVAFQGAAGAFSEQALLAAVGRPVSPVGLETFDRVGEAVVLGDVRYGFLPLENTLAGTVAAAFDVLAERPLKVRAEVVMPIRHCLLAPPGTRLEHLEEVVSHPVALAQCRRFFLEHPAVHAMAVFDTAGGAAQVAAAQDRTRAAIAPIACAERYGLDVLAEGLEDRADNQTRWVLVSRSDDGAPCDLVRGEPGRSMIRATIAHETGALARLLTAVAGAGRNLTKIEGRPARTPWSYRFFLETDGPTRDSGWLEGVRRALPTTWSIEELGHFPSVRVDGTGTHVATDPTADEEAWAR